MSGNNRAEELLAGSSDDRILIEIESYEANFHLGVLPERLRDEGSYLGGLLYVRGFNVHGRVLAPRELRGRSVLINLSPLPPDLLWIPSATTSVGRFYFQPGNPDLGDHIMTLYMPEADLSQIATCLAANWKYIHLTISNADDTEAEVTSYFFSSTENLRAWATEELRTEPSEPPARPTRRAEELLAAGFFDSRILIVIEAWQANFGLGMAADDAPPEASYLGRLSYSRGFALQGRVLAPKEVRGSTVRVNVVPRAPELLFVPGETTSVGRLYATADDPAISDHSMTVHMPEADRAYIAACLATNWKYLHVWISDPNDADPDVTSYCFSSIVYKNLEAWVSEK